MFPGRLLPIVIFAEDDHRRTISLDTAARGGHRPRAGPPVNRAGALIEEPRRAVAGGISGQVILMEGVSPRAVELETPGQQPLIIDGPAVRLQFPLAGIESRRRW